MNREENSYSNRCYGYEKNNSKYNEFIRWIMTTKTNI